MYSDCYPAPQSAGELSFVSAGAHCCAARRPDDGGGGPEEDKGVGADRWYRKAMVQEENAEPAEQIPSHASSSSAMFS